MPIQHLQRNNTFRTTRPSGHYDMVIVSLVHQPTDILDSMRRNIERYVKGKFLWVVHYNNEDPVDETKLPDWMWIVRHPIWTDRSSRTLTLAIAKCLEFALQTVSFTNAFMFSSGSLFFRDYEVPKQPVVKFVAHNCFFEEMKEPNIGSCFPIETVGKTGKFLESLGLPAWQYGLGFDEDIHLHERFRARNFTHVRGSQWAGQVWPQTVARWLVEDMRYLEMLPDAKYTCEEIYLTTYASNFAEQYKLEIDFSEVVINWSQYYNIDDPVWIEILRAQYPRGVAVCRVNDVIGHPVRSLLCD